MAITPQNFHSLHQHEEAIRADSLALISADESLSDHLQAVHDALGHLKDLLQTEPTPGGDQHTIQLVIIRLFNIGASALKLGLSGYYQQALHLVRDLLEAVDLVDLFRADRSKIAEWRNADNKTLKKHFRPAAVRAALEKMPQFKGQKAGREDVYSLFSELAAHTTYRSFRLIAPDNAPKLGAFMDAGLLRAVLEEMGQRLAHVTVAASCLVDHDSMTVHDAKNIYLIQLGRYHAKYIRG